MEKLNEEELRELDSKIDSHINECKLLSYPRNIALIHLLRYFEDFVRLKAIKDAGDTESQDYGMIVRNGLDGMHFAVQWVFKFCPDEEILDLTDTQDEVYVEAHKLHEKAINYSIIWDFMNMLWRKRAKAFKDADGIYYIEYDNQIIPDIELADKYISAPDPPDFNKQVIISQPDINYRSLYIPRGDRKLKIRLNTTAFNKQAEYIRELLNSLWELDPSWDLGGYTIGQFREFWITLLTLSILHHYICLKSGIDGGAVDSVIRILRDNRWVNELSKWSDLSRDIVENILNDLIFDFTLYESGKKPDIRYQPFFHLGEGLLALSNQLVLYSNSERNIWDLISIKRPDIHSRLRNEKENLWIRELTIKLNDYGLKTYGPVKYTYNGKESDLDMLVLDYKNYFGIGFQLKWLTNPDAIKDVHYTEKELEKGLKQGELTQQWLNSKPASLITITGISEEELEKYEFKTMVLSKNTIGSGWVNKPDIPIINERLLHWVLGEPHKKNLKILWYVGEKRRYLPERNKHFREVDIKTDFGEIRFIGKKLGLEPLESLWSPEEDIDLTGLE